LFVSDPENIIFNGLFTPEELHNINEKSMQIKFVDDYIHLDDTIETIKKKLIMHTDINSSFGELYLFSKKFETINSIALYQKLTQNEKLELTKERLMHFLLNIDNINTIIDKDIYTYDDILSLGLDNKEVLVSIPIGQMFIAINSQFPYTVNPFNVINYDSFLEQFAEDITTTTNKNILMNSVPIFNNTIYVCTAENVLHYARQNNLSQESSIKIYFPFLLEKKIIDEESLNQNKQLLKIDSEDMINKVFERNTNNVNLFYNIYYGRLSEIAYTEIGIKEIKFTIHPNYLFNMPLDVIFKLIHATEQVPFIKFNPAVRQENIYRIYTDKIATNGKKIPYLNKAIIFKLMKSIGTNRCVALYIEHFVENNRIPIICEFENNGDINVKATFSKGLSTNDINKELSLAINPIINIIKDYLTQNGYSMNNFTNLNSNTIEINSMDYIIQVPIKKQMKLKGIIGCLSSIFNVVNDDINKGIVMRFKRVANYNEMDSQEAFIIELLNGGYNEMDIIKELILNFELSDKVARTKLAGFVSSLQVVQSSFQNKKLKIKNNPGFETTIVKDKFDNTILIKVTGINDIRYLESLSIYIDSIIRITQYPESTSVPLKTLNSLCKGVKINDETQVNDIIATTKILPEELEAPDERVVAQAITFAEEQEKPGETMLDILFGLGSDYEDDNEEDEQTGGVSPPPSAEEDEDDEATISDSEDILKTDMTGKRLSNPNPFFTKLHSLEPSLFLTESEGKFKAYSRMCAASLKKQPVILTNEEKIKIDKEHPGSYNQSIHYGSDPKNKYWYICPRFWSLKDNSSITEEEAKSGKYGSIIPLDAKKVPPGGNIIEFREHGYPKVHSDAEGDYVQHYPGFLNLDSHPDGKSCIPCCFSKWNSPSQIKKRNVCTSNGPVKPEPKKKEKVDEYIKGPEKFPLDQNRYGFLPLAIQKFLHTNNKKCQISATNSSLKPNHPCFLRHGVEPSKHQSFIACIADIMMIKSKEKINIKLMNNLFINALTIDIFMTLQNGNLIDIFYKGIDIPITNAEINKYTDTKLYKNIDQANPSQLGLLKKVITSYNNFINYLSNDTIEIDYTYLWDLISIPNPKLFPQGLNIIILELINNDITDNVQILCPSNHYSPHIFDSNKESIILMKIGSYFEPIYIFENKQNKSLNIISQFKLKDKGLLPNIKMTLEIIKQSLNTKCMPFSSMPSVYKFNKNIILETLVDLLKLNKYDIVSQVMNYNGKIIGVLASKNKVTGIVPCFPSAPITDLTPEFTWMDDNYGNDYMTTIEFLKGVHTNSKGKIPCNPLFKVSEDGLIIGILTQTNQFVILSEPSQDVFDDDLTTIDGSNLIIADKLSITDKTIDDSRIEYIHKIRFESSFYNAFRNTMRYLIGEFTNRQTRSTIEKIITSPSMLYLDKLQQIDTLLRHLMKDYVIFTDYSHKNLSELGVISNCYMAGTEEKEGNDCSDKKFCQTNEDSNICVLSIPEKNLINDQNNNILYFGRIADELIRYNRIKSFIFQPKSFLAFSSLKYNLKDDEIILLQSLLNQDYFHDLIPMPFNKYIKYNTFDNAQPIKSQMYNNEIGSDDVIKCDKILEKKVSGKWSKLFPGKCSEIIFSNEPELCSFDIILTIIKDNNQSNPDVDSITKYHLKELLAKEYINLQENYNNEILQILTSQGKAIMTKLVSSGQVSLSELIMSYDYYATNLDIWLLAFKFKIPLIFISDKILLENGLSFLVANHDIYNTFYFIYSPSVKDNIIPKYKLIVSSATGSYKIHLESLQDNIKKEIKENITSDTLIEFIKNFSLENAIKHGKQKIARKPKLIITDD
jgi:hypothetical protein